MMMLGPIGFAAPWLLLGLAALPLLWWLLRALPPVPRRVRFPGTVLLAGLVDPQPVARRTPWWLLMLRLLAVAAAVLAFAAPVWRPAADPAPEDALLIVMDAGATAAPGWAAARSRAIAAAEGAMSRGAPVALLLADGQQTAALTFSADDSLPAALRAAQPQPWPAAYPTDPAPLLEHAPAAGLGTLWLSDGLDHPNRGAWLTALAARGTVRVVPPATPPHVLRMTRDGHPPGFEVQATTATAPDILALGPDPQGIPRELARLTPGPAQAEAGITRRPVTADLPPELLGRVTRFQLDGIDSAAAVVLGDDRLRRPVVAVVGPGPSADEGQALLSPRHFILSALDGPARAIEAGLSDAIAAKPDVIVILDRAGLPAAGPLAEWVAAGGMLIRFAGPRMAAAPDLALEPLLPVALRPGGRDMGGALSWGEPRAIAPFDPDGPFAGLTVPQDVTVRAQLMAEPSPDLSARSIAVLSDGTPLVTRAGYGQGQLVLFHSTANADWSSLPISGLFVQMLQRLIDGAGREIADTPSLTEGGSWTPLRLLDGFGRWNDSPDPVPVAAEVLAQGASPQVPAGIYASGERVVAVNAGAAIARADWPGAQIEEAGAPGLPLQAWLLLLAALALMLDLLGSAALRGGVQRRGGLAAMLALALLTVPQDLRAQEGLIPDLLLPYDPLPPSESEAPEPTQLDPDLVRAASHFALAYVLTGDSELDELSRAGLTGLSQTLAARTTVEPSAPVGVDLETADLSLLAFLYWPVGDRQPLPSAQAYLRLNRFLRGGGMILFDSRDADLAGSSADASDDLRRLAGPLDMPPLQIVPRDHVLTRSFYLLDRLPGRFDGGEVWVAADAAPEGGAAVNDGVSPVVIGGNAWAEAWAVDQRGLPLFAVGSGFDGERQREIAHRFGVNLIMYVLTGNYKSDQIHVPALLQRLQREQLR